MISVALLAERWDDSWLIPSTWWTEKNSRRGSVFGEVLMGNMGKYGKIWEYRVYRGFNLTYPLVTTKTVCELGFISFHS